VEALNISKKMFFGNFSGIEKMGHLGRDFITFSEFKNLDDGPLLDGLDLGLKLRTRRRGLDLTPRQVASQAKCSERLCQTNSNQSQFPGNLNLLGCTEDTPLG
jgi:hypothetical protein